MFTRRILSAVLCCWALIVNAEPFKNSLGMEFVRVPAGSFTMGCNPGEECEIDEKPAYTATVGKDFWISKTEVTQAQWKAVMGSNPSEVKGDNLPVENVDWASANAFADALSQDESCGNCYRLPTEMEWEYMARLDGATLRNAVYGGKENGINGTEPVCSRKPGKLGLCDVLGNVFEWTAGWYTEDYHRNSATTQDRVLRGSNWYFSAYSVRPGYRLEERPDYRCNGCGFRLLRTSP